MDRHTGVDERVNWHEWIRVRPGTQGDRQQSPKATSDQEVQDAHTSCLLEPGQRFTHATHSSVLHGSLSESGPTQGAPSGLGGGESQARVRLRTPVKSPALSPGHDRLQAVHSLHTPQPPLTTTVHRSVLHGSLSAAAPRAEQGRPPNSGGEHTRLRRRSPPPQELEHDDHDDHSRYAPSMGGGEICNSVHM